jgi:hypothetical protein
MTFSLDNSRDQDDRVSGRRKLEVQTVGEILSAFGASHEIKQEALATGP